MIRIQSEAYDMFSPGRSSGEMVEMSVCVGVCPWLIFFFISHRPTQTDTDKISVSAADIVAGKIVSPSGKMIKKS